MTDWPPSRREAGALSAERGLAALAAGIEWPTLLLIVACTGGWMLALLAWPTIGLVAALLIAIPCATLHSSLQHEAIHGHPTASNRLNALLVLPAIGLFVPYHRFRDLHIHHHRSDALTDPEDDPESFYLTARQWQACGRLRRGLFIANNTLLGRMTIGPAVSLSRFYAAELRRLLRGERGVRRAWAIHVAAVAPVVAWVWPVCGIDPLLYLAAVAYPGYGLLMLRTFAEHQAHPARGGRTAIVEDRGPLAWLFLFNSLHVVHHRRPDLPWYLLPRAYWRNRRLWTAAGGPVYRSYATLAARHLLRAKEPVPHPAGDG